MNETQTYGDDVIELKTVALRGLNLLPKTRATFEIGRERSIKTLRVALANREKVFLVTQKDIFSDSLEKEDLYSVGVIAFIEGCQRLSNGHYQVVVLCESRARLVSLTENKNIVTSCVKPLRVPEIPSEKERECLTKIRKLVESYLAKNDGGALNDFSESKKMMHLSDVVDFFASNLIRRIEHKQLILEEVDPIKRSEIFMNVFMNEIVSIDLEKDLFNKTIAHLKRAERENFLREQARLIQAELNEDDSRDSGNGDKLSVILSADLPDEIREKLIEENSKLRRLPFGSMESNVISSYIDFCVELPWNVSSKPRLNIPKARKILDRDHTGMEKVKERIIEYLSVRMMNKEPGGQILCLVGAPGVGKTSVAKSIAEAMGRNYSRVSLGGIRDEADIRGHRKTYVGAMPGRIITAIKNSKVNDPLILLDEIDKLTMDAHGDPASALLEVLDSEQNCAFRDHFLELPFDLSKCFFVSTANTLSTIPKPLLDRMEVIELESYTELEKLAIAKKHLVKKQIKRHGLNGNQVKITDSAINKIIDGYTREAGVRNLEREIASVCRKCAKLIVEGEKDRITVTHKNISDFLGPEPFLPEAIFEEDMLGCVNGLAWTSVGGELMRIEVLSMEGTGKVELTGSLGNVMKESALAAISYIRKHAGEYGIDPSFYSKNDIHIHAPEGAVPKDGPSAGIAMTTAIISELSGKRIKRDVAMTGEITLTGRVLPIGGLKEKTMAAYKAGVKTVILPKDNEKDILKLDNYIKEKLTFKYVSNYGEVAELAFAN